MIKEQEFFKAAEIFMIEFKDEITKERNEYMLGKPKYKCGDEVRFLYDNGRDKFERFGKIEIIDAYGTFDQNIEPSYDIMGIDNVFYKHVIESNIFLIVEQ